MEHEYLVIEDGVIKGFKEGVDKKSITDIKIPEGVTEIGKTALVYCYGLASVTIPDGVTKIGECAFSGCEGLVSVEIPASVTSFGSNVFTGCDNLANIIYGGTLAQWCERGTDDGLMSKVKSVILAGEGGMDLKKQTALKIPEGVKKIGRHAFYECASLTNVDIPESVKKIETRAFFGCESLESVTIPAKVKSIGDSAFWDCKSLKSVEIPEGVTKIGKQAFYRCESLASMAIPVSVTNIGSFMFPSNAHLTYAGTKEQCRQILIGRGGMGFSTFVIHCTDGEDTIHM